MKGVGVEKLDNGKNCLLWSDRVGAILRIKNSGRLWSPKIPIPLLLHRHKLRLLPPKLLLPLQRRPLLRPRRQRRQQLPQRSSQNSTLTPGEWDKKNATSFLPPLLARFLRSLSLSIPAYLWHTSFTMWRPSCVRCLILCCHSYHLGKCELCPDNTL
ncbi:uncharacterized protein EI90DRAFT_1354595 [Cantharellus anzutake]|uniref:uncharacterized protein n=1 Tax=Cantharellus anzutake TaxID=1750568 RepID=UPI001906E1AB|nr:uncharacterized protein EI90DRAFT_857978 [Cantharellus anzutake]XP_038915185.1 uncharacterized protein EI90DRAFT_1354595 [Cantharellus anzutake]KAF8312046.1 hypothetical protein EI90DRAFT_857978 [Cantharellus anzutake]KAF8329855.1 hypothetical protein EI90DRAFT_1354595 [Cantharellus anzutake]